MSRAEEIHMKEFKGTRSGHDSLRGMLGSGDLSSFTSPSPTNMVFEEFDTLDANDMLLLHECMQVPHPSMTKSSMP